MPHCEDHSGCVADIRTLQRDQTATANALRDHCKNGEAGVGHVQRHEVRQLREDVNAMTESVRVVHETVTQHEVTHQVAAAGMTRADKILMAALTSLGPIAVLVLNYLLGK